MRCLKPVVPRTYINGVEFNDLLAPLPLGIAAGLVLGKQLGIFGLAWLAIRSKLASMPKDVSWLHIYGLSCLAGIGFTMSLFIGGLAFVDAQQIEAVKMGVLAGSVVSALVGLAVLAAAARASADLAIREKAVA